MHRLMIIGCSGSGKSTLARQLAERSGLPLISLDRHFWSAGWTQTPDPEWEAKVEELSAGERWIIEGNYSRTFAPRIARADTIVFLDRPTYLCVWRVLKRTLKYWRRVRPGMSPGCPERFDWQFTGFVLSYNRRRRPGVKRVLAEAEAEGKRVVRLRSDKEVKRFLAGG